jgi:predicted SAM-dependent methyltransferase
VSGVRIEVGIGANPKAGYLHCDIVYRPGVDCVCDAACLPFASHVADRVFCRHLLEHLNALTALQAMREWHRVLQLDGVLDINVPDLAVHCIQLARPGVSHYMRRTYGTIVSNQEHALRSIFGWQQDRHHYHYWGYTADSLRRLLGAAGFCDITRIDDGMFCNIRFVARKGAGGDLTYRDRRPLPIRLRTAWNDLLALVVAKLTF